MSQSGAAEPLQGWGGSLKDLTSLRVFARVVEFESFSEVARQAGVTPATVSKHVAGLESALRTRLVNRTTRRLFITEAGRSFYEHCVRVLGELDLAESELAAIRGELAGPLRVTAPLLFAEMRISKRLPDFLARHPKIALNLDLSVEKLDLFRERIDVAVRIDDSIEPGLVAFRLAPYRRVFCASPSYLDAHGVPLVPEDLARHNCFVTRGSVLNATWPIRRGDATVPFRVNGNLVTNNGRVNRDAALAGLGIAMSPLWLIDEDLRTGALVEVLAEFAPPDRAIWAVLPRQGSLSPKVRVFLDFLKECCGTPADVAA